MICGIACGIYEGRSKSFAIQYDVQMAQTKQLHYFSM